MEPEEIVVRRVPSFEAHFREGRLMAVARPHGLRMRIPEPARRVKGVGLELPENAFFQSLLKTIV